MPTYPDRYPSTWLVEMAKVQRSSYYKWLKSGGGSLRKQNDVILKQHIVEIHQLHKMYGYPRVKWALRDRGFVINHKKVYRLMCERGVHSIIRKKRGVWKNCVSRVFDNVLERNFKERTKNEVFVTDITYLPTKNDFLYLSRINGLLTPTSRWQEKTRNLGGQTSP